jgi:hypothetical protein
MVAGVASALDRERDLRSGSPFPKGSTTSTTQSALAQDHFCMSLGYIVLASLIKAFQQHRPGLYGLLQDSGRVNAWSVVGVCSRLCTALKRQKESKMTITDS